MAACSIAKLIEHGSRVGLDQPARRLTRTIVHPEIAALTSFEPVLLFNAFLVMKLISIFIMKNNPCIYLSKLNVCGQQIIR